MIKLHKGTFVNSDTKDISNFHYACVIPCKECKHLTEDGFCFKNINGVGGYKKPNPDDFCSYGELKEESDVLS